MAAVLRGILARNKCLLPSRKLLLKSRKPLLTSSMCTDSLPSTDPLQRTHPVYPRLVKDGWEFSLYYPSQSSGEWLCDIEVPLPTTFSGCVMSIKHLDSGIAFRFSGTDALYKRIKEKITRNPLASDLPSYNSPLLSELEDVFDSAYVGRVVIEKQSEEPFDPIRKDVDEILDEPIDPIWKSVDQKILDEKFIWMTKNEHVSGEPLLDPPFENGKREAEKTEANGMLHPLVNFVMIMYKDVYGDFIGRYYGRLHLVITDFGWFLHIEQPFRAMSHPTYRLREMTMHCCFKENIIYREITERQHENFEKRLSEMAIEDIPDDEPHVYFHEVKQLRIQDVRAESESLAVPGAARYSSFTVAEKKKSPMAIRETRAYSSYANGELKTIPRGDSPKLLKALPVPDSVIESLISSGKPLQHVEEQFGSSIQILPLFRHPFDPTAKDDWYLPEETPRKAYIVSSKYTEEYIKSASATLSNLANSLERTRQQ